METNIPTEVVTDTGNCQSARARSKKRGGQTSVFGDRIKTIDIVRGVALCGILLMNIPLFGIHWSVFISTYQGPHNTADFYTMNTIDLLFEGTMRGLFSMLVWRRDGVVHPKQKGTAGRADGG
jgi:hypothetical protein